MSIEDIAAIQESLAQKRIGFGDPDRVRAIAESVLILQKAGVAPDEVLTLTAPGEHGTVSIRADLSEAQLGQIARWIVDIPAVADVHIFPKGIITPQHYRMQLNLRG